MDDRELRDTFEEYFDGVQAPPESVIERAKNRISGQRARTRLLKRISVAAACVACACLVTVGVIFSPIIGTGGNKADSGSVDSMGMGSDGNSGGSSPSSPDASGDSAGTPSAPESPDDGDESEGPNGGFGSSDESYKTNYYPQSKLTPSAMDIGDELPAGLEFVVRAAANGFAVGDLTGYYSEPTLFYAQTEITSTVEGVESKATVYAEFTDSDYVCDIFKPYFDGKADYYQGNYCLITSTSEGGKWVCKVFMRGEYVKYYLEVTGTDKTAYASYLDLILGY